VTNDISSKVNEKISSKVARVEAELNEKFEKLADQMDERVSNMIQKVQVEGENCTEETLKRQGEKAAQLDVKSKYIQGELREGLNMTQVKDVTLIQDSSRNVIIENIQGELLEELDMTQVKGVTLIQDKTNNNQISPAEADHGIVIKSTNENTLNCKSIYLFTKYGYACSSRTVRIDITVYERDRIISYNKVTKYKKYRRLEWCINSKRNKSNMYR
jgi:hypothetical protein